MLGSPVRLLLVRVLRSATGSATAAELADDEALGTSGQVYHHVRQLVAAGWLRTAARGRYAVPAERVVPLLVALALAGAHRYRSCAPWQRSASTWRTGASSTDSRSRRSRTEAGVSGRTVLRLEGGSGATLENVLRVARALGVLDEIVRSLDPYSTDVGRARADEQLPRRVRHPRRRADT
ncbi:hypothetical protein SAMN06264364_11550 [Quadrisphaera granulorum]|uniref:HTH cro/C1-type domain-containing protein n=1 Tax=Quadrisphaera granulorum TaxID=317664 RepID=A0A316A633_9ACTN|nr:hypothetical protein [Quadrisphaera granulorum]PWJ53033.1 hypothetical protein BXY45_11550 [Quadrisphaera granulorum]SZE97198.1 hypothetical protein SAMN06264364_11550 [Quadrisphaera granulorum]